MIFHVVVMVFMLFSKKGWGEVETDCFFKFLLFSALE